MKLKTTQSSDFSKYGFGKEKGKTNSNGNNCFYSSGPHRESEEIKIYKEKINSASSKIKPSEKRFKLLKELDDSENYVPSEVGNEEVYIPSNNFQDSKFFGSFELHHQKPINTNLNKNIRTSRTDYNYHRSQKINHFHNLNKDLFLTKRPNIYQYEPRFLNNEFNLNSRKTFSKLRSNDNSDSFIQFSNLGEPDLLFGENEDEQNKNHLMNRNKFDQPLINSNPANQSNNDIYYLDDNQYLSKLSLKPFGIDPSPDNLEPSKKNLPKNQIHPRHQNRLHTSGHMPPFKTTLNLQNHVSQTVNGLFACKNQNNLKDNHPYKFHPENRKHNQFSVYNNFIREKKN